MVDTISIVIMCRNEERIIKRCIDAIQIDMREEDELIVVDTGSTDNTIKILSEIENIIVYHFKWNNNFAEVRNFGIDKSNKDWVFFIDSDEILIKGSIERLSETIDAVKNSISNGDKIVFSPKIINTDDSILYNAGRIVPNDNTVRFEGCIHEYPIVIEDSMQLVTLKLSNVAVEHDGYEIEIIEQKNKTRRNTDLIKKIIQQDPNNARYYYFYYRDAEPILTDQEYERGMIHFFEKFPNNSYGRQVAKDLAYFYLKNNRNTEAEEYIARLFKSGENGNADDRYSAIYLTGIKELQKIKEQQKDLLKLLIFAQENAINDEQSMIGKGYAFDDLIGQLFFLLEEYETSFTIAGKLESTTYPSHISQMISKLKKVNQIYV